MADCLRNEKVGSNAPCRKILSTPQPEACYTRAPQRGDSAVSTFAGRMEQSCVVALGKAWVRGLVGGGGFSYAAGGNWSGSGGEELRLWPHVHMGRG